MKAILLCFTMLLISICGISQLVPELYNDKLVHQKQPILWKEKTTTITEIENDTKKSYVVSKVESDRNDNRTITLFDDKGEVKEVSTKSFVNENLEVHQSKDGNKEETQYDANDNIISITWTYPNGSIDQTTYTYEDGNLVKIIEQDPFDMYIEELKYEKEKLIQIKSIAEDGSKIMTRKFTYNENGMIEKMERIQDEEINKLMLYDYDDSNVLILKEEKKINRFTGAIMPPETYEYTYHANGILKEEKWTIYTDENYSSIKDLYITQYNELGLETKEIIKDFSDNSEQIYEYTYKMK